MGYRIREPKEESRDVGRADVVKGMGRRKFWPGLLLAIVLWAGACGENDLETTYSRYEEYASGQTITAQPQRQDIPGREGPAEYEGEASVAVNGGIPFFTTEEITTEAFETYAPLDSLGRCGTAFANVCEGIMPTGERGSISSVKPTGWHSAEYDIVPEGYLYNRCHLIGYQLAGENANEENLITGTRYMNVEGMLPWENLVAEYVEETGNHVLYRVTPDFQGENLVASGVWMEAYSVEDEGAGVCFNVYCYNVQPGIQIDYATGESREDTSWTGPEAGYDYILNTNTMKFHRPSCSSVSAMSEKNREYYAGDREALTEEGYEPCQRCNP